MSDQQKLPGVTRPVDQGPAPITVIGSLGKIAIMDDGSTLLVFRIPSLDKQSDATANDLVRTFFGLGKALHITVAMAPKPEPPTIREKP